MAEKKGNKAVAAIVCAAVLIIGIAVAGGIILTAAGQNDSIVLTYAEVNPLNGTIAGEMAKAFKQKAEELSDGKIIIDIQAAA